MNIEGTYVVGQLAVVQVSLEQNEFTLLEILEQLRRKVRYAPVTALGGPERVRTHDQLTVLVEVRPLLEEEFYIRDLLVREWRVGLARVIGRCIEGLRVRHRTE